MAELVAAVGVPHSPHYPSQFPKDGPEHTSRTYRAVKDYLDAARADAIVVIANDHFNTFFMNNFPTFAIGVAEAAFGPNDQTRMPHYDLTVHGLNSEIWPGAAARPCVPELSTQMRRSFNNLQK